MTKIAKNTICIWYEGDAEEAARFYAKTFPDSSVGAVHHAPGDFPSGKQGDVLTVEFTVMGIPCLGLNGEPAFKHNEAFSFALLLYIRLFLVVWLSVPEPVFGQAQDFELRNQVAVTVTARIAEGTPDSSAIYGYALANGAEARQSVWRFVIVLPHENLVTGLSGPAGWYQPRHKPKGMGYTESIRAVEYAGWGAPPEPPIAGYDDITPYGPGRVGRTIGPVRRPDSLIPAVFMEHIIGLMHEAYALGWLRNQGLLRSLDAKLDSAKAALIRGQTKAASFWLGLQQDWDLWHAMNSPEANFRRSTFFCIIG